jgi:hypothetical protein
MIWQTTPEANKTSSNTTYSITSTTPSANSMSHINSANLEAAPQPHSPLPHPPCLFWCHLLPPCLWKQDWSPPPTHIPNPNNPNLRYICTQENTWLSCNPTRMPPCNKWYNLNVYTHQHRNSFGTNQILPPRYPHYIRSNATMLTDTISVVFCNNILHFRDTYWL